MTGGLGAHRIPAPFNEGTLHRAHEKLARTAATSTARQASILFGAPNAKQVSVIGDFNGWNGTKHPMRTLAPGIWETFVPNVGDGDRHVRDHSAGSVARLQKTDPHGILRIRC